MDSNIDKVREALKFYANSEWNDDYPGGITFYPEGKSRPHLDTGQKAKQALAALSAIDSEAIRRESKAELIKKLTPIIEDMDCTCGGESDDSDHSYEVCGCWKHELQAILSAEPAQDDGKEEAKE